MPNGGDLSKDSWLFMIHPSKCREEFLDAKLEARYKIMHHNTLGGFDHNTVYALKNHANLAISRTNFLKLFPERSSPRKSCHRSISPETESCLFQCLSQALAGDPREPQFKNAIMTLASEAAVHAADDPVKAIEVFHDVLDEIRRVIYYRPKEPRPFPPRVTKRSLNKWASSKIKKVANA